MLFRSNCRLNTFTTIAIVTCITVGLSRCIVGVEVHLPGSTVIGLDKKWDSKPYWAFAGIRYGTAPVNTKRFQKASLEPLSNIINATSFGHRCHPIGLDSKADEDCLFINVFCPPFVDGLNERDKAVMVFVHGGGNIEGNPEFVDGGPLTTENDLVVVTFNYRLGPLGFLSVQHDHSDGNYGLLDQRLAMVWTQRYIRYFGGDETRVTLAGVSAGGKDISVHTVSSGSRDLFHRAIMLSGTLFGPSLYTWDPVEAARRLAGRVNCTMDDNLELKTCLRRAPATDLSEKATNLWPDYPMRTILDFGWGAVRDGEIVPNEVHSGMFRGEVLLGVNSNEGSVFTQFKVPQVMAHDLAFSASLLDPDNFKSTFIKEALYQYYLQEPSQVAIDAVYRRYMQGKDSEGGGVSLRKVMDLYADQQYVAPALEYLWRNVSSNNTYLYYFDHNLMKNERLDETLRGALHTDDQAFVLGLVSSVNKYSDQERKLSSLMRIYISNFVKTGNPNEPVQPAIQFMTFNDNDHPRSFLHVTGNTEPIDSHTAFELKSDLLPRRMSLWESTLPRLMALNVSDTTTKNPTNGAMKEGRFTWTIRGRIFPPLSSMMAFHIFLHCRWM